MKPVVKKVKVIKLPSITNSEKGVFIVELIGNGLSSRAIIKKGTLSLLNNFSHAGTLVSVMDEN